ncbi:hypothetical protein [Salinispora arenicola]|uniref:hypothetical protein n=1 Tax=Salinispora arenicola TaxID=168697 RepID=UPI00037F548A|nr:hypothetical protein [Salinispora arenicola]
MTWTDILHHWAAIEADLHEVYGIDVEDPDVMRRRSWRWLRVRVAGLLAADTRITRAMRHRDEPDS